MFHCQSSLDLISVSLKPQDIKILFSVFPIHGMENDLLREELTRLSLYGITRFVFILICDAL